MAGQAEPGIDIRCLPVEARTEMAVSTIRDLDGLDTLSSDWDLCLTAMEWAGPMLHSGWARSCLETRGAHGASAAPAPQIIVAEGSGSIAVAPLSLRRIPPKRLEFIGQKELLEAMDFPHSDSAMLETLAKAVADTGYPLHLRAIPASSPALAALLRAYRNKGIVFLRSAGACPWIALDESWGEPERHLKAGRASDLRRARRRAERLGCVSVEILAPSPGELAESLDEAYRVEAGSWKSRKGTALLTDLRLGEFYRRYATTASRQGILRLCFLRIDGMAAAMQMAVETGNRFWLMKVGYSETFARCSPGILLMAETIRHAARAGLRSYEFLGTTEPWIHVWTRREHPCLSLRAYPFSLRGAAALAFDSPRAIGKWLRARI